VSTQANVSQYFGKIIVVASIAALGLVFYFRNSGEAPHESEPGEKGKGNGSVQREKQGAEKTPVAKRIVDTKSYGRLALLNAFHSLDRVVVEYSLGTTIFRSRQFLIQENATLARQFVEEVQASQNQNSLVALRGALDQLLKTPGGNMPPEHLGKLMQLPGGEPVAARRQNVEILQTFQRILSQRILQLQALFAIDVLGHKFEEQLAGQFETSGIEITRPEGMPSKDEADTRRVLRYLELSGTRFLLAICGNAALNKHTENVHSGQLQPIYRQALNAALDPANRRFRTIATYLLEDTDGEKGTGRFRESPDGWVALVRFSGALPRAKLYSDWRQGMNEEQADELLYSPGFNPHMQVVLRESDLPEPDRPAATVGLPLVIVDQIRSDNIKLKAPALKHNAVLFLNDDIAADWHAIVDGEKARVLRANNQSSAVYLAPGESERVIEFNKKKPQE
tara:strand:+ start:1014 stop:2369 length:1356 start_codon:yes stop_codon:yes gene_type:complete